MRGFVSAERGQSRGRTLAVRSCAYASVDSTEIFGFQRGGIYQGQECNAIHLARVYGERKRNFVGQSFWARGYFVSTIGRDEAAIRDYIRNQEKEDQPARRRQ